MFNYVYRIDRPSKGEYYIGMHQCRCWPTEDTRYWGSGKRIKLIERSQLRKTILVIVETSEEAARIERELIGDKWETDDLCLNLCSGGDSPMSGRKHTVATRDKMSAALMGNIRALGNRHSKKTKAKMSASGMGNTNSLGHQHSEESKAKMSESQKGHASSFNRKHTEATKALMSAARIGNPNCIGHRHTPETKAKMSAAQRGKVVSAETKARMSAAAKLRWARRKSH